MTIPETTRVIYANNPLEEVICQLRFPTILAIAADQPVAFQDSVRRSGYPYYQVESAGAANIPTEIADKLRIEVVAKESAHQFKSEESDRIITLSSEFLAVADRNYREWPVFRDELLELARTAFEAEYQPGFYDRVGLRYRNTIDKVGLGLGDVSWSELVNSSLAGILGDQQVSDDISTLQGTVIMSVNGGAAGGQLRLRHGLVTRSPDEPPAYAIDADFYVQERRTPEDVPGILDRFNQLAGHLFRWAITERLHETLGPA